LAELGFTVVGREFSHPETEFTVEFPAGPIAIGNQVPILPEGEIEIDGIRIKLLSPTQ
jgi:hypothetical protein